MHLLTVCVGHPETLPGKRYRTGINKHPVDTKALVTVDGVEGDAVCDRRYHGGPDQAVYVEGGVSLVQWSHELGRTIRYGEFGENLVVSDLDNQLVAVGDRISMGEIVLEITAPRMPCATFATKMNDPQFVKRYRNAARPGFYCRVLKPGLIEAGMRVTLEAYDGYRITMPEMMRAYGKVISGDQLAAYLSAPIHRKLRTSLETGKVKF